MTAATAKASDTQRVQRAKQDCNAHLVLLVAALGLGPLGEELAERRVHCMRQAAIANVGRAMQVSKRKNVVRISTNGHIIAYNMFSSADDA